MQLHLLSGGAAEGLVKSLAAAFTAETGATIEGTYAAVGAVREKLLAGAPADVVILSKALIGPLTAAGHLDAGTHDIGVVPTSIAVREADMPPDVATADALRSALLAADGVYTPDPKIATAGAHFAGILEKLGIAAEIAPRLHVHPNGMTAMRAMTASADRRPLGCTQMTEIVATPGLRLAGPLPPPFELSTVYSAAVAARSSRKDLARALTRLLTGPASASSRCAAGFAPV